MEFGFLSKVVVMSFQVWVGTEYDTSHRYHSYRYLQGVSASLEHGSLHWFQLKPKFKPFRIPWLTIKCLMGYCFRVLLLSTRDTLWGTFWMNSKTFKISTETKILRFSSIKISRDNMEPWFWWGTKVPPRGIGQGMN